MTFDENTNTYTTSKGTSLTREEVEETYRFRDFEYYCEDIRNEASNLETDLTEDQIAQIASDIETGDVLQDNYFSAYFECLDDAIIEMRKGVNNQ